MFITLGYLANFVAMDAIDSRLEELYEKSRAYRITIACMAPFPYIIFLAFYTLLLYVSFKEAMEE